VGGRGGTTGGIVRGHERVAGRISNDSGTRRWVLRILAVRWTHGVALALAGLIDPAGAVEAESASGPPWVAAEVVIDRLAVLDRPDDWGYVVALLERGDRVRVHPQRSPGPGWFAIAPPATAICWIERDRLDRDPLDGLEDRKGNVVGLLGGDEGTEGEGGAGWGSFRAWLGPAPAEIRWGHPRARMPGPPAGRLPGGTMVLLVDRPPLRLQTEGGWTTWLAIVPPEGQVAYVPSEGLRFLPWDSPESPEPVGERRVAFERITPPAPDAPRGDSDASDGTWPREVVEELARIDAMVTAVVSGRPIARWRFDTIRAAYQALLRRTQECPGLEEALRDRLLRVTRFEQAARSARTFEELLEQSRQRDRQVAQIQDRLARSDRARARAFEAIGFLQPSARRVEGRKVFALIGREGSAVAYLDIPPGLDPKPFLARSVGVRGRARFHEELGTRLIAVSDLEDLERSR